MFSRMFEQYKHKCRAIAGRIARCRCKFRYVLKFRPTAASRGFHCDSTAFELFYYICAHDFILFHPNAVGVPVVPDRPCWGQPEKKP